MTKEEMITAIKAVHNPKLQINIIYKVLDELGVKYKKSTCGKCRNDLYNIAREELGLIESAADVTLFDKDTNEEYQWKYLLPYPVWNNGVVYNQKTDVKLIEDFVKRGNKGYYEKVKIEKPQPVVEEENINNEANFILK